MSANHVPILVADEWPRPDQAHVAEQHVPQLRQLVERATPEKASDTGDAGVAGDLEQPIARLIAVAQSVALMLRTVKHRPELDDSEVLTVTTDARLSEQHRP